ncbi:MAG: hypothetical protein D4R98_07960 [Comamonadaceae bacterium]|nr:MAG: hypothetical protein D4R98_07960 [Comamonadaceae bacterium]
MDWVYVSEIVHQIAHLLLILGSLCNTQYQRAQAHSLAQAVQIQMCQLELLILILLMVPIGNPSKLLSLFTKQQPLISMQVQLHSL